MVAKIERPVGVVEKVMLGTIALIAIGAWFSDGVAWYQPILFFFVIGGLVINVFDSLHKRESRSASTRSTKTASPSPSPSPAVGLHAPKIVHQIPVTPDSTRSKRPYSVTLPELHNKKTTADVLVCIHGLDESTTERLERLCSALGFSVTLQANANADLAVTGADSHFDFASANVPIYSAATLSAVLHKSIEKFALSQSTELPIPITKLPSSQISPRSDRHRILDSGDTTALKPLSTKQAASSARVTSSDRIVLPHTFSLNYQSSDGHKPTWREVNISSISTKDNYKYLEGYCYERQEFRTFRTDRIRGELLDMETGELIPVSRLLSELNGRATMVYQPDKRFHALPSKSKSKSKQNAVLFTGFAAAKRELLEAKAQSAGWSVRVTVGPTLDYLVTGPRAGPTKVAKSRELGVSTISEVEFLDLI